MQKHLENSVVVRTRKSYVAFTVTLVLFWAIVLAYVFWPRTPSYDVAVGERLLVDLGEQPMGTKMSVPFRVRNTTARGIQIEHHETSCGCTVPSGMPTELAPGQSSTVVLTTNPGSATGKRTFTLTFSSSGGLATTLVGIKAQLVRRFPEAVDFGRFRQGAPVARTLTSLAFGREDHPPAIRQAVYDKQFFDLRINNDPKSRSITFAPLKEAPAGPFHKRISVILESAGTDESIVDVTGWIERDVEIDRSRIDFGNVEGSNARQVLRVYTTTGKPIDSASITSEIPGAVMLVGDARDLKTSSELAIQLDPKKTRDFQSFSGRLLVNSDNRSFDLPLEFVTGLVSAGEPIKHSAQ